MDYIFHIAHGGIWYGAVALVIAALVWRVLYYKEPQYLFPLATHLKKRGALSRHPYKKIISGMRFVALAMLALGLLQPQLVDPSSRVRADGIAIMLALDVSGSMSFCDFKDDDRSRFEIAKDEACHFIKKRDNDAIGLVLFGRDAVSRCPLTRDTAMVLDIVHDLKLGMIDEQGTVLAKGLLTAINRLKHIKAASKIIILLTDGSPGPTDTNPEIPLAAARRLGIKIYTIGIGSEAREVVMTPFGQQVLPGVNKRLLEHIAYKTGGRSFMARSSKDMHAIYTTIDALEKSELEVPLFRRYHDLGIPLAWGAFLMLLFECCMKTLVWFGL